MTIQGYQFDKCKVTPEADAALYYQLNNKQNHVIAGYKNEMNVTSSGLNVYVDTGCALVMGRYCEITNQEQLSVMANTEGYVCITIDLTETNTAEGVPGSADYIVTNNQLRVEIVEELVKQDLFNDGQIYTFPLSKIKSSATNVSISMVGERYNQRLYSYTGNGQCDSDIRSFVNTDSNINLLRKGDQVFLNARVGLSSGNASIKDIPGIFDIPLGYRKGSYVGTSWNIACAVGRHGKLTTTNNVSWFAVVETERLNFLSTVGGNHYITATWITNDPMPA